MASLSPPLDVRPGRDPRHPAGPAMVSRLLRGSAWRQNAADFLLETATRFGDVNHYRVLGREVYQINHPDLIADFFLRDAPNHHRNLVMQRGRDVLGHGLLTSEEPMHMRQRRLAQPAFLRERIAAYAEVIGDRALRTSRRWKDGETTDIHPHMMELALEIVGKCLFDLDALEDVAAVASAVDAFMSFVPLSFLPFSQTIERMPLPAMRRLRAGKDHLDKLIYGMIAQRRANPDDRGDLLSMLLHATDPEDAQNADLQGLPAQGMTDRQLHDECVTIILAGHETTANALSLALHLLSHHPEIQHRLAAEATEVLGDRAPTAAEYARLPYATQVFAEALRLYPPVWVTARTCIAPYRIAGYTVPVGATVVAPQYAVHRDPRWFAEPDRFDPERFTPEAKAQRPRYAYFPFAGGSRQCIGEGLAWMEGTLCLAVLLRDWVIEPVPGSSAVPRISPAVSLRPKGGVTLRLKKRVRLGASQ